MAYPRNLGDKIIFKEQFLNKNAVLDNGGTVASSPTISNGATFDGTDDSVTYLADYYNVKTIKIVLQPTTTTEEILSLDGSTISVEVGSGTVTATGVTSPTIYVDGAVSSTLTTAEHVLVITTATAFDATNLIIGDIGGTFYTGIIKEVVLSQEEWTATEVTDDFEKDTYLEINPGLSLLYIPSRSQYNDGTQKTTNIGTAGDMTVGDGSTSTTYPSQTSGLNKGFNYDGGDYLQIADATALRPTAFTVALLLRSTQTGNKVIFEKDTNDGISVQRASNGAFSINVGGVGNGGATTNQVASSDGYWHTLICVHNGSNDGAIYLDGVEDLTLAYDGSVPSYTTGPVYIGGRALTAPYAGDIVDPQFFDFGMTPRQVRWLHERYFRELNI